MIIGCGLVITGLAGCSLMHHNTTTYGASSLPPYSGPKARIVVADFDVKAAKATGETGSSVREMLVTALTNSNRFSIVERQQVQAATMQEKESSSQGAASASDAGQQKANNKAADLVITASVTEFEPQASGGRAGVGGGGGVGSGILGGLLGTALNKARMGLDISIVDISTSNALATTHVQGQASDVAGVLKSGFFGKGSLGPGLSVYANTPMEKAIRICIIEAVRYMAQTIPPTYYKYNSDGKT